MLIIYAGDVEISGGFVHKWNVNVWMDIMLDKEFDVKYVVVRSRWDKPKEK